MMYLHKECDGPDAERIATCVWSHLFCTEPSDSDILVVLQHCGDEISRLAAHLLEADDAFRRVMVSTLWVALAVCRSRDDRAGFDRIMASDAFKLYSAECPMLSPERYSALVENWSRKYAP